MVPSDTSVQSGQQKLRWKSVHNRFKNGDVFVLGDPFGPSIRRIDTIENTLQLLESAVGS